MDKQRNDGSSVRDRGQPLCLPSPALRRHPELARERCNPLSGVDPEYQLWDNGPLVAQVYAVDYLDEPWAVQLSLVDEDGVHAVVYAADGGVFPYGDVAAHQRRHEVRPGDVVTFRLWWSGMTPVAELLRVVRGTTA